MDGVLANFEKRFKEIKSHQPDHIKFRDAVMIYRIFEDLEFMPDTQELLNHVSKLNKVNIEILTSMGTFDAQRGFEAKTQKIHWLNKHNIPYKANFVRTKTEKARYATPTSILIDDSIGCITPFNIAGGHGILHTKSSETIDILDNITSHIFALRALRS